MLIADDLGETKTVGHENDAHNGHGHREFVADHLRGAAQAAEKRILTVRSPSGECDTVDAECGDGKKNQQADVGISDPQVNIVAEEFDGKRIGAERNYRERRESEREREERREKIDK